MGLLFFSWGAVAADEHPKRELIYGAEIMSHGEREQYRKRLRGAKDAEEKSNLELQHRARMRERARVRGVELSEPSGIRKK